MVQVFSQERISEPIVEPFFIDVPLQVTQTISQESIVVHTPMPQALENIDSGEKKVPRIQEQIAEEVVKVILQECVSKSIMEQILGELRPFPRSVLGPLTTRSWRSRSLLFTLVQRRASCGAASRRNCRGAGATDVEDQRRVSACA